MDDLRRPGTSGRLPKSDDELPRYAVVLEERDEEVSEDIVVVWPDDARDASVLSRG